MRSDESNHRSPFEVIRQTDDHGNEYWNARDLGKILGYETETPGTAQGQSATITVRDTRRGCLKKISANSKLSRFTKKKERLDKQPGNSGQLFDEGVPMT